MGLLWANSREFMGGSSQAAIKLVDSHEIRTGPDMDSSVYFWILGRALPDVTLTHRTKGRMV